MKKTFAVMSALLGMALFAQEALEQLKIPEGENLLANPTFQEKPDKPGQLLKWGGRKDIKFSWIEENGRKILRAETSTPGYHLGINQQVKNLKPNTEYLLYLAVRGKISDGSIRILYHEGRISGQKKAVFAKVCKGMKKDFPWTLFQIKFRTPSEFEGGVCSIYAVLLYGTTQIDLAQAGLIECRPKALPLPLKGAQNLLVNPELKTSSLTPGFPCDWNMNFAERKESYRYELDKDGCGIVTLLPFVKKSKIANFGDETVTLTQSYLTLNPGKKYRIGALVRTRNFKAPRSGLVVTNFGWSQAVGINSLPENTDGWKRIEADVILPKSRFCQYFFYVYTVGCRVGEVQIKSPYLIPIDADAAEGIEKAPAIHTGRRITPVAPLLCQMSAEKPQMTFSFRSVLPKAETDYECRVRIKSADGKQVLAQGVFPLKKNHIHAAFKKLAPEKILLETELIDRQTGRTFASERYPAELCTLKLTRPPEKRLNMLTQRLLTADARDGKYVFSAPRDGWVFISLSAGKSDTAVKLDGNAEPVIRAVPGRPFETLRHVFPGDHMLELANTNGGKLIVNSIPEILINGYPHGPEFNRAEMRHRDYLENFYYPNITTIAHGYRMTPVQLKNLAGRGKELLNQTMHARGRTLYETPEELVKRFRVKPAGQGRTFDEIYMGESRAVRIMTQALERLTDCPAPMYFWSSGVKFHINGLNAAYFSSIANHAKGKGKFIFECYARTQDTEEKADIYLEDYLNESIRRAKQLMPDAEKYSLMVLGMYTNAGNYCTDTYAGPDVKAFWNKVFYKWANDPEFKDLAGVGLYAWANGNEESLRWAAKLIRHYVIEGNTEDLAAKYGYHYLPGHLKNGDFTEGLAHWTAKGSVKVVTVKNLGRQYQKRMWFPPSIGDTACLFTRSDKSPNTLTARIGGLTPGKQYVLRYLLVDNADIKAKKPSGKKILMRAKLDGAKNITASSPVAKYLAPDGVNIRGYVNNVAVVFKAEKPEVDLTFSDWAEDTAPGAPVGQEILLNKVGVTPYFSE